MASGLGYAIPIEKATKSNFSFIFSRFFRGSSSRKFKFSILLRRPWAWARGGPGLGQDLGLVQKDGKCFFCSARFFQAAWAQQCNISFIFLLFFGALAHPKIAKTRGTCAQAHEKELLECSVQLSVQLTAYPEGLPSRD